MPYLMFLLFQTQAQVTLRWIIIHTSHFEKQAQGDVSLFTP